MFKFGKFILCRCTMSSCVLHLPQSDESGRCAFIVPCFGGLKTIRGNTWYHKSKLFVQKSGGEGRGYIFFGHHGWYINLGRVQHFFSFVSAQGYLHSAVSLHINCLLQHVYGSFTEQIELYKTCHIGHASSHELAL